MYPGCTGAGPVSLACLSVDQSLIAVRGLQNFCWSQVGYGKDRFRIPTDLRLSDDLPEAMPQSKRQKLSQSSAAGGSELKADPVLWRVNSQEFNRSFRYIRLPHCETHAFHVHT